MASTDEAYQEAVAFLQKTNLDGDSVYEQLAKVVGKILAEKPDDAVDLLETAIMAKKTQYVPPEPPAVAVAPKNLAVAVSAKELFSTPRPTVNLETGEPEELTPPNDYGTENVLADAAMYEAVGLGLSKKEMYGVMLCVKRLGENPDFGIHTVRFFGKMLGTGGDYYVFETTLKDPGEETEVGEGKVPVEVSGTGANTYTYWTCSYLGGPLTKLPDCTPDTIVASRRLKRYLTGTLTAPVSAYPPFPGTEAHYLRALVGRIASATVVCPVGYFKKEEEKSPDKDVEFVPKEPAEMVDLTAWAHRYPHIKEQGRCDFFQFPVPEPEEGEEPPEPPDPETGPEQFQTLDLDAESTAVDWGAAVVTLASAPEGDEPPGEPTVEPRPAWVPCTSSNVPGVKYQVVGIRSLVWPGAFVAYTGVGKPGFSNCYVGYGFQNKKFVPAPPPVVEPEFDLGGQVLDEESGETAPAQMVMSVELPPIPEPEPEPEEAADGEEAPAG